MAEYRNVCVTATGDLKFVDLATFSFWFYGKPAKKFFTSLYSVVNAWILDKDELQSMIKERMVKPFMWIKDGMIEDDEFADLLKRHNLPCAEIGFPLVDIKNTQIIYFALGKAACDGCQLYLISIDMSKKTVFTAAPYLFGTKTQDGGDCCSKAGYCKPHYCCNLINLEPFLACDFCKYSASII